MPLRVLVVDDAADVVEVLCVAMSQLGHHCRTAVTGAEALRVANEFAPHLILLDIELPDVAGYDVAATLRARGSDAYIVALTGWARESDIRQALECGCDEHFTKPARRAQLASAVEAARHRTLAS